MTFDLAARGKTITDKFSDINMWEVDRIWTEQAAEQPRDYFAANFPFVRRIQLMAATGGNEQRDLFRNPRGPHEPSPTTTSAGWSGPARISWPWVSSRWSKPAGCR